MSEENEQGDDNQKDASETDEFHFYFSFTKPLVLELPSSEDRAIAAAWVQKLEAEPESEEEKQQRLNYLKLLLFVLQRGRLSGIFKKQPPSGSLQPFPQGFSILDMGNWMLDQDDGQACGGGDARNLPYTVELSNDLREFAASQEIPNFGIQMYYAWSSDEPVHKWESFDEEKFPQFILDKIKQLKETKSDEKSHTVKNCGLTKKKGCDLSVQDKYSKKKVKSPQEIERSQGRSFHTYMGLVGRMGNFNDKCDDDPEKFQRQDPRRMKCQRRNVQKRCPGSGGEAEDMPEEEFDNLVTGLGGLNNQNKSCACPNPCHHHHQNRPDLQPKGGPQSFEDPQAACRNMTVRGDVDNPQYNPSGSANKSISPRRRMGEQPACPESEMPEMMSQQRMSPSGRPRSNSPMRPNMECPPPANEGNAGRFQKQKGVCICSSPPCTCPCPRGAPQKATSNANSAERTCPPDASRAPVCPPEASRTSPGPSISKSPKQDACPPDGYRSRAGASHNNNFHTMDSCSSSGMSELVPPMARGGMRGGVPEIVHCYDARNPDPSLAQKLEKQWTQTAREFNRNLDTDFKNYLSREQLAAGPRQPSTARRAIFAPQAESTLIESRSCQPPDMTRNTEGCRPSPRKSPQTPLESNPCNYPPPEDVRPAGPPPCSPRGNQQMGYGLQQIQQNYMECESEMTPQMRTPDPCGAPMADSYKKSPPPQMNKSKNTPNHPCSSFPMNDSGRLANMNNGLQGSKQRTEPQKDKCEPAGVRRSPPNDAACYPGNVQGKPQPSPKGRTPQIAFDNGGMVGVCGGEINSPRNGRPPAQQMVYSPQVKPSQYYSPVNQGGYVSLSNSMQNKMCTNQQQIPQRQQMRPPAAGPECYPNRQQAYEEPDKIYPEEEDFECASTESMEVGPSVSKNMSRNMAQSGAPQTYHGNPPVQDCPKQMPPSQRNYEPQKDADFGMEWISFPAYDSNDRDYTTMCASQNRTMNRSQRSPGGMAHQEPRMNGNQGECLTQQDPRANVTPREMSNKFSGSSRFNSTPQNAGNQFANICWASPKVITMEDIRARQQRNMMSDPRCQEVPTSPPCPASSPPPCPAPSPAQQRSPNYAANRMSPQNMNTEQQYQDEFCEPQMGPGALNAPVSDMDVIQCDQQNYMMPSLQEDMCGNVRPDPSTYTVFTEEDNRNFNEQNFLSMLSSTQAPSECFSEYQEADTETWMTIPSHQSGRNKCPEAQMNVPDQNQRNCSPNNRSNRMSNCRDPYSGQTRGYE